MNNSEEIGWLAIDWGTTNFRIFAMSKSGDVVKTIERPMGILQVKDSKYSEELKNILTESFGDESYTNFPVMMAGMIGSKQGWHDANYVPTPSSINTITESKYQFTLDWGADAAILPGISHKSDDRYEVMRGEEIQLFGLSELVSQDEFCALFPGTHSKHIYYKKDQVVCFDTFMTGELFSVLSKNSILGANLPEQQTSFDDFQKGVLDSKDSNIMNALFQVRTKRLFGDVEEDKVLDYLSGLLIGYELRMIKTDQVYIVGGEHLTDRYKHACGLLGVEAMSFSGDNCFVSGMKKVKEINDDN